MNDIRKNPKTYTEITTKDIDTVFNSKAFFWRKFPATLSLESYYDSYGALKYAKKEEEENVKHENILLRKIKQKEINILLRKVH
jgi:hypothetical protein